MLEKIDELLTMYDNKQISRRQLLGGLLMASATVPPGAVTAQPTLRCPRESDRHSSAEGCALPQPPHQPRHPLGARHRRVAAVLPGTARRERAPRRPLVRTDGLVRPRIGDSFVSVGKGTAASIGHFAIGLDPWPGADRALEMVQARFPKSEPRANQNPRSKAAEIRSVMLKDPDGISVQLGSVTYQL
jgi:hypothetical protein